MNRKWTFYSVLGLFMMLIPTGCSEDVTPPVAAFTFSPQSATTADPVTFDASESEPGSCDGCYIVEYKWDFENDGVWDQISDNSTISYQFQTSNIYEVVLQVRNNQGYTSVDNATQTVEVVTSSSNGAPSTPSVSYPSNGSVEIEVVPTLTWSSVDPEGDNLIYDIYLGTSESPQLIKSSHETNTYTPDAPLDESTTYFWKIVAKDTDGNQTTGPVWQFTTTGAGTGANQPPNKPTAPYPETLSADRPLNQIIEWEGSDPNGDELSYEVYFGTSDSPPLVEIDYSGNTYNHGTLASNTTYYWRIVAFDPDGESTSGELWQFTTGSNDLNCPAEFTDTRNNKTYSAKAFGTQCWMTENLEYGEMINSGDPANNTTTEKYCYNNNENNCDTYGALYQWNEMMQYTHVEEVGGICPEGWHIPSETEWHRLVEYFGGNFKAGKRLKNGGTSGFDALLAGTRNTSASFEGMNLKGYYWSSTELDNNQALQIHFDGDLDGVYYNYRDKGFANSLRCVKD